jgi:hypothetical protein
MASFVYTMSSSWFRLTPTSARTWGGKKSMKNTPLRSETWVSYRVESPWSGGQRCAVLQHLVSLTDDDFVQQHRFRPRSLGVGRVVI